MEEEVRMADYGEDRVAEWEEGLPTADDLTPLSQSLVPPALAAAFSITPEPSRSILDVNRESQNTLSSLRGQPMSFSSHNFKSFNGRNHRNSPAVEEDAVGEGEEEEENREATDSRKLRRIESTTEEADSAPRAENLKRPRLVWTPQLHKRFVDVVAHLGIKNAVPKTIMQLMNVDGLTRENVASHLQKYRLYLKRMQGLSNEGPSSSDQLFASTPVPQNLQENGGNGNMVSVPMAYGTQVMPMPVFGMGHGHGPVGMPQGAAAYRGFESNPYNMLQPRDWPGNKFGSAVAFPPSHAE